MSRTEKAQKIRNALAKICRQDPKQDINRLRVIVALERAIARMETIPQLEKHIVFKGGFVLLKQIDAPRFTRDLDVLARGLEKEEIAPLIQQALRIELDGGMWYGDVQVQELLIGARGGLRFVVPFQIGEPSLAGVSKLSRVNIDVGIGDQPPVNLVRNSMPSLVHTDLVSWVVYPFEYIFAEKLEALFRRGGANSRAKDVYDLSVLFSRCPHIEELVNSIRNTFSNRGTPLPKSFFGSAEKIDTVTMQMAWVSVVMQGEKPTFDEIWRKVLSYLKIIDASGWHGTA